jgi:hypothetical protein
MPAALPAMLIPDGKWFPKISEIIRVGYPHLQGKISRGKLLDHMGIPFPCLTG